MARSGKIKLNFLNMTPFLLNILIVFVEIFLEHYNKASFG